MVAVQLGTALLHLVLALTGLRTTRRPENARTPLSDEELPHYSVLVPLYREAEVLPRLLDELIGLDYPTALLQILVIVEAGDDETRTELAKHALPDHIEVLLIEQTMPRTKAKACNLALRHVRGELCTIYDAEDRPDPGQLRTAAAMFHASPEHVVCLQARLRHWNPNTNWLAASMSAEYALRYGAILPALNALSWPIPLGGNSNHFRTPALCRLGAWDPHNLTEDADLGIRIARHGWTVRTLDSTTDEEANAKVGNWLRQRSRWVKGHTQTWLVHTRNPLGLLRELGPGGFAAVHLVLGGPVLCALISPLCVALLLCVSPLGPASELGTSWIVEYHQLAALLTTGYLVNAAQLAITAAPQGRLRAALLALTVPAYWTLLSIATYKGLLQLLRPGTRYYWERTRHGLVRG
nr:glycosyltransferase [Saccharopolyspora sp. HNM0983]